MTARSSLSTPLVRPIAAPIATVIATLVSTQLLAGCAIERGPSVVPVDIIIPTAVGVEPASPVRSPASKPVAAVAASPETRTAVAAARSHLAKAERAAGAMPEARRNLEAAESAAASGNNPRAQSLARQAHARADYALNSHYTRRAAEHLQGLFATTGLDDADMEQMRAAEAALIRGESARALTRLQKLSKQVRSSQRQHTVQKGESLMSIAAKPEVYGNSLLWPLIFEANRALLSDPGKLKPGQSLSYPAKPTVDQVVAAIETARQKVAKIEVGPVIAVPP
jgi:nucleoid-associated protein YgaU